MECPKCNYSLDNSNYCKNCKSDLDIIKKTVAASNRYYNIGLSQANDNDMSGAIISLNRSLMMNKNNIVARNLLGLIFFKIGQIGDALKQWIISSSFKKDDNPAEDYIMMVKNNEKEMEKLNDAIQMYNQALVYMNQKSEDMAIIQLKKAIENSPNLIEAKNLLSICYLYYEKNMGKAKPLTESVLFHDSYNSKALQYRKLFDLSRQKADTRENIENNSKKIEKTKSMSKYSGLVRGKTKGVFPVSEIVFFIVGAMCAIAVMYVLLIPGMESQLKADINTLNKTVSDNQRNYDEIIKNKENEINELTTKNEELSSNQINLDSEKNILEKSQAILSAQALYSTGNSEEAAVKLLSLDVSNLPEEYKAMYKSLSDEIYPVVANRYYNDGVSSYNNREYDNAKVSIEQALKYGLDDRKTTELNYYLGRIAEDKGETDQAIIYYQKAVNVEGVLTNSFYNAQNRLNDLQ